MTLFVSFKSIIVWRFMGLVQISHFKVVIFILRADSVIRLKHFSQKKQQQLVKKLGFEPYIELNQFYSLINNRLQAFAFFASQILMFCSFFYLQNSEWFVTIPAILWIMHKFGSAFRTNQQLLHYYSIFLDWCHQIQRKPRRQECDILRDRNREKRQRKMDPWKKIFRIRPHEQKSPEIVPQKPGATSPENGF